MAQFQEPRISKPTWLTKSTQRYLLNATAVAEIEAAHEDWSGMADRERIAPIATSTLYCTIELLALDETSADLLLITS